MFVQLANRKLSIVVTKCYYVTTIIVLLPLVFVIFSKQQRRKLPKGTKNPEYFHNWTNCQLFKISLSELIDCFDLIILFLHEKTCRTTTTTKNWKWTVINFPYSLNTQPIGVSKKMWENRMDWFIKYTLDKLIEINFITKSRYYASQY